jgi:Family of unknown function (DUF6496)
MPSNEIMPDFAAGTLHSGRSGKIVTNRKQAIAIKMSYKRKEDAEKKRGLRHSYARERAS